MKALSASAQLAQWIEREHSELFAQLYQKMIASGAASQRVSMRGLGDDYSDLLPGDLDTSAWSAPDVNVWSAPTEGDMADVSNISFDSPIFSSSDPSFNLSSGVSDASSSIGSGISSAASSVGNWMTSSQGLTSLANLTKALVASPTQQQILQAQTQRALAGQQPAPITYAQTTTGQIVPVVTNTAAVPIAAVQSGQATPISLSNGSVGYAVAPATALQVASGFSFSSGWLLALLGLGLVTAIVL